ncbi:MAG: hypothetical protein QOD99_82 [Chthoniobacter sp.]|jgi:hypothetical protein|nr:hypothetical protein [Chthoniobacter sp.]
MKTRCFLVLYMTLCLGATSIAESTSDTTAFSSLKLDPSRLAKGDVIIARIPGMGFSRGQAIESAFVVKLPPTKAIEAIKGWNASVHPELKVYLHADLASPPTQSDFQMLSSAPNNPAIRAFVAATQSQNGKSGELQLSAEERSRVPAGKGGNGVIPDAVRSFWSDVLNKRSLAFLAGGIPAQPPYEISSQKIRPSEEFASLLKSLPKIRNQFTGLLDRAGLTAAPASKPSLYWELFDADGEATLTLGAAFASSSGNTAQAVDVQFYATGSYFAYLTLYQLMPFESGGISGTLIWRADLISAASLGTLHGIERNAAGAAMVGEIQKLDTVFQKDNSPR